MEEIWKDIKGYEGKYQISNYGRVKSFYRGEHILSANLHKRGYYTVNLYKYGKRKTIEIHRLVANAFCPNKNNKKCVNHIDGNKLNNTVSNLEWCTYSENLTHAYKMGLRKPKKIKLQEAV